MQLSLAANHAQRRQPWFALRGPVLGPVPAVGIDARPTDLVIEVRRT